MSGENETNLSKQLLDLTKQMLDKGRKFSLKLLMPSFNFSINSTNKEAPTHAINKKVQISKSKEQGSYKETK